MKRVLPDISPSLDYTLWKRLADSGAPESVTPDQRKWLSSIDTGHSNVSDLWTAEGRNRSQIDKTKVFDFISLSKLFDEWFDQVKLNPDDL